MKKRRKRLFSTTRGFLAIITGKEIGFVSAKKPHCRKTYARTVFNDLSHKIEMRKKRKVGRERQVEFGKHFRRGERVLRIVVHGTENSKVTSRTE